MLKIGVSPTSTRNGSIINGITFTYDNNGVITANGTNTSEDQIIFWCTGYPSSEKISFPFDVKVTGLPEGASSTTFWFGGANINAVGGRGFNGYIIPANAEFTLAICIAPNYTCDNLVFKPMIVPAYEDTNIDYSSYSMRTQDLSYAVTKLNGLQTGRCYSESAINKNTWIRVGRCYSANTTWSLLEIILSIQFSYESPFLIDVLFGKNNQGYPYWTSDRLLAIPLTKPRTLYLTSANKDSYPYKVAFKMVDEWNMDLYLYTHTSIASSSFISVIGSTGDNRTSSLNFDLDVQISHYTDEDMTKIVYLDMYNTLKDRQYRLSGTCWGTLQNVTPLYTYDIVSWNNNIAYRFFAINHTCEKYIDTYFILRYDGYSIQQKDFGENVNIIYAFDSSVGKNKLTITIDYEALNASNWLCRLTRLSLTEGFSIP